MFTVGDRQVTLPQPDVSEGKEVAHTLSFGTLERDVLAAGHGVDLIGMHWTDGTAAPFKAHV